MNTHVFFLELLTILLAARIFAEIAVYLKTPPVIGELVAGILLGPSLLGWLEPNEVLKLLAEIGIILLLFQVGLETNVRQLVDAGKKSFVVALGGFIAPFVLGMGLSYFVFELSILVSIFIGGTLTATSIGVTVRVLSDLKAQHKPEGQIVLGAAVLDDILGVVLLALLFEFSIGDGISMVNASKVLIFVGAFFVLAPLCAKLISQLINRFDSVSEIPGLIPTTIVSLVLFFAWLAHIVGAPELLGGFAAGLALSRRFFLPFGIALHTDENFANRIEQQMRPIVQLFTPIFFVMVGLSLNLQEVNWSSTFIWTFSFLFLVIAIASKFSGALLINEPWPRRVVIGLAMVPRGEVGLIFAELGRINDIFNNEVYAGLIIVIALTTILPAFAIKGCYRRFQGL